MARLVVLDTGPLGLASSARGKPDVDRCLAWIATLTIARVRIVVPDIADYEVRRELIRANIPGAIARLDHLVSNLEGDPITIRPLRHAAEFWAIVRRAGLPTADPHALDGDCILAAQASLLAAPGDVVTIATTNARHLARFPGIDAREWDQITP